MIQSETFFCLLPKEFHFHASVAVKTAFKKVIKENLTWCRIYVHTRVAKVVEFQDSLLNQTLFVSISTYILPKTPSTLDV